MIFHCKLCRAAHESTTNVPGLSVPAVPDSLESYKDANGFNIRCVDHEECAKRTRATLPEVTP